MSIPVSVFCLVEKLRQSVARHGDLRMFRNPRLAYTKQASAFLPTLGSHVTGCRIFHSDKFHTSDAWSFLYGAICSTFHIRLNQLLCSHFSFADFVTYLSFFHRKIFKPINSKIAALRECESLFFFFFPYLPFPSLGWFSNYSKTVSAALRGISSHSEQPNHNAKLPVVMPLHEPDK